MGTYCSRSRSSVSVIGNEYVNQGVCSKLFVSVQRACGCIQRVRLESGGRSWGQGSSWSSIVILVKREQISSFECQMVGAQQAVYKQCYSVTGPRPKSLNEGGDGRRCRQDLVRPRLTAEVSFNSSNL